MHQAELLNVDKVKHKVAYDAYEVEQLAKAIYLSQQTFAALTLNIDGSATNEEINQMLETMIDEDFL